MAPLTGGSFNIENTLRGQYASVLDADPSKLILGVPYYGAHWTTSLPDPRAAVTGWAGHVTFATAEPASQTYGLQWDSQSLTPWYRWNDGADWHQVWFDNAASLGHKYDLAIEEGIQGVGMWALGYDGDREELWAVLESRFGPRETPPVPTLGTWGLGVLSILAVTAGILVIGQRGHSPARKKVSG